MRITYLTNYYYPEVTAGANRAYEQAKVMKEYGHHVRIITGFPNYPQGRLIGNYEANKTLREDIEGIEVIRCPHYIGKNKRMIWRLVQYVCFMLSSLFFLLRDRELKKDVDEQLLYISSGPIFVAIVGFVVSMVRKRKYIVEFRDITHIQIQAVKGKKSSSSRIIGWIEKTVAKKSLYTVVSTQSFKDSLIDLDIHSDKIIVVYNGILAENISQVAPIDAIEDIVNAINTTVLTFMYIGTIGLSQELCEMIDEIETYKIPKQLVIIGDGAEKENVIAHAIDAKYEVLFFDSVPKAYTYKLYELSDIQIVKLKNNPLFGKFMPSKVFDILSAGKPILYVGPDGEVTELIDTYHVGFRNKEFHSLIEDGSVEAIKNSLSDYNSNNRNVVEQRFERRQQLEFVRDIRW